VTKSLERRLSDAKADLIAIDAALVRGAAQLPGTIQTQIQAVSACASDIDHWITLAHAREAARRMLDDLEGAADTDDQVPFGSVRVKFQHARLIGVQAYLAASWALADRIAGMAGRVLCTPQAGSNPIKPPQLNAPFLNADRTKQVAASIFDSVPRIFGWPIGISYALRNHFIHDGGQLAGANFFHGFNASSRFKISDQGWANLEEKAQTYSVLPVNQRIPAGWPPALQDDLRVLLDVCETQMDDALGVLAGTATKTLRSHVAFLIGED